MQNKEVDWSKPIWDREEPGSFWDPGKKLLKAIRDYQARTNRKGLINNFFKIVCILRHKFWSVISGAEIDLNCEIGGGLLIPHPNGIVIHPSCVIGPNCLIFQQVTLASPVTIGYHVDIGAGAKILGPLTIHNNARIGANAVVTKNVDESDTVIGIPAKSINSKS